MRARPILIPLLLLSLVSAAPQAEQPKGAASITPTELKEWLSYIASDQLEGRQVYTEGLGLAAEYIADHLKEWGVKPAGENGTYFQTIKVQSIRTASKASVTVDVNGQTRTFKDGEGITFPRNMGGKQTIDGNEIAFAGYGLQLPANKIDDYKELDPKGKVIVWLGAQGPEGVGNESRRLLGARTRNAIEKGAAAVIAPAGGFGRGGQPGAGAPAGAGAPPAGAPAPAGAPPAGAPAPAGARGAAGQPAAPPAAAPGGFGRGGQPDNGDFTTVQVYDAPVKPQLTATDEFFEFLFSGSDVKYAELKEMAAKRQPLPHFTVKNAKVTINVDADYNVVRTRLSRNVVGMIEGSDPKLKDTYVAFGAHYDHVGYRESGGAPAGGIAFNSGGCEGQQRPQPAPGDIINNGADDDGSGTVALMALAKAFATGPTPRRSLMVMWHAGEEAGLLGSRYNADHPVMPLDKMVAQLNIDMIGRNRCDRASEANTVYLVGSDRISTELHNISEDTNAAMPKPMKLDYEMNDPADPESIYTRSDHYSYASKGIPIIFYTTGLHRDYHFVTDEVSKIEFPKMAQITQLVYATGMKVANNDKAPERDNKGPRMGKGSSGKIASGK